MVPGFDTRLRMFLLPVQFVVLAALCHSANGQLRNVTLKFDASTNPVLCIYGGDQARRRVFPIRCDDANRPTRVWALKSMPTLNEIQLMFNPTGMCLTGVVDLSVDLRTCDNLSAQLWIQVKTGTSEVWQLKVKGTDQCLLNNGGDSNPVKITTCNATDSKQLIRVIDG